MPKIIVTHYNPDRDGIFCIWILKKFDPEFQDATIKFVSAGKTYQGKKADSNEQIVHVDTGFGRFDHHQKDEYTCAAEKVLTYVQRKFAHLKEDQALNRIVAIVKELDHARDYTWDDAANDRYEFHFDAIMHGWKLLYPDQHAKFVDWGLHLFDAIYKTMKQKILAEKEIEKGHQFESMYGKALAVETYNDDIISVSERMGFQIVARKDPGKGYVRIKAFPDPSLDLTPVYEEVKRRDPDATWFLHPDKHQLLNGSTKDPQMRASVLKVEDLIEVIKNAKAK
ncbi:MAG TPA: hypothetical protein VJ179_02405 [Patescibacteria group bacterium]|nr:hypothetical protein [Patescibacteria group bacterium]